MTYEAQTERTRTSAQGLRPFVRFCAVRFASKNAHAHLCAFVPFCAVSYCIQLSYFLAFPMLAI